MNSINREKIFSNFLPLFLISVIYLTLTIISWNYCYFWDVIQQISKEAHWYYLTDFKSILIPTHNQFDIKATGYHPPLMGMITAVLWKVIGYKLYVSHLFTAFWLIVLIYNARKLVLNVFPYKYSDWVLFILLIEPVVITQFVIASPDFILLAAFVTSLRAIFEKKHYTLAIALIFLCGMNMRGVFVGVSLFFVHIYYESLKYQENKKTAFLKIIIPYLPILVLLSAYYIYYFTQDGWFFTTENDGGTQHYTQPKSVLFMIKHLASFILSVLQEGRIVIFALAAYFLFYIKRRKIALSTEEKTLLLFTTVMYGLYFIFVFVTQMPFGSRYFAPQFFTLTILVLLFAIKNFNVKKIKYLFIAICLCFISGHFWIYPESISKSWDTMLTHIPYYELRKEVFNYIDKKSLNYNEISTGFGMNNNRKYVELIKENKTLSADFSTAKYFVYSNILNLEDDKRIALQDTNQWQPIQYFEKKPVHFIIYKRKNKIK